MSKIALYIRLSIEDSKVESMSVENQKLALHKFVDAQDGLADYEVQEFVDNGYSGTNLERPALQEMLDGVRTGEIKCIVVKDFSRFGRNSLEVGYFMEKVFPLYGVRFVSLNDDFDTAQLHGDTGGMNVAFKYLMNEFYSRDLSLKYKSAKYIKFKSGEYQSKICPYGYQKGQDGRLEPDPETAPNVQFIFEMAAQGCNTTEIIRCLFDRHISTPGEYKARNGVVKYDVSRCHGIWGRTSVLNILKDERYTGTYIIGKRESREVGSKLIRLKDESKWINIPDHHPALVSKEQYDIVQKTIRRGRCIKKDTHLYPLYGKVYCGTCGHRMQRVGNKTFRFYCKHTFADETAACHGLKVEESELETVLYQILRKQAQAILGCHDTEDIGGLKCKLTLQDENNQKLVALQEQKRMLFENLILHKLSEQEYKQQKAVFDHDLGQLQQVQVTIASQVRDMQADEETKKARKTLAQNVLDAGKLSAKLVDVLIEKMSVFPGQRIEIAWKIKDFCMEEIR